jgi:hypothetical protein
LDEPDVRRGDEGKNRMIESEEQLKKMMEQAGERERRARRNALLYTLVPVALAIGLLVVTGWQVKKASQALADSLAQFAEKQAALSVVEAALTDTNKTLTSVRTDLTNTNNTLIAANQQITLTNEQKRAAQDELTQVRETLTATTNKLNDTETQLKKLEKQVAELSEQLKLAKHFDDYYYHGDLMTDVYKNAWNMDYQGSARPGVGALADKIFDNLEIDFRINGTSFTEGVNSPTYVAMILGLMSPPALSIDQGALMQFLPLQKKEPQVGDVVYYDDGLTLFYFEDEQGQKLVMGMTPFGVVALNYDFATPLGIGDTSKVLNR